MRHELKNPESRDRALYELDALKFDSWHIDQQIRLLVLQVLKHGGTWREIGKALGVSGQAAWQRYGTHPAVNGNTKKP